MFILVTFYTFGSAYEAPAKALVETAKSFGINAYAECVQDRGGWCRNTELKPHFVRRCMSMFPDADIAYSDADSILHAYPSLFDAPPADITIRRQDFPWRSGEWLSGTFLLRNTPATAAMVDSWASRVGDTVRSKPETWEQAHLGRAILESKISVSQLPPEYVCFDLIERVVGKIESPVFSHMQYSRRNEK